MNLNNPFVDTNVIISQLFKYEPEHYLTENILKTFVITLKMYLENLNIFIEKRQNFYYVYSKQS